MPVLAVLGFGLTATLLVSPLCAAQSSKSSAKQVGGIFRMGQDVEVASGDSVNGPVIAINGSISISGSVNGPAIAIGGSVDLKPGAYVNGPAIAVGGRATAAAGAEAKGPLLELPRTLAPWRTLGFVLGPMVGLLGSLWLAYKVMSAVGWIALAVLAWLLFPKALENSRASLANRPGLAALAGVLYWPCLAVVALTLLVSILGIPILPLLALGSVCAWLWGFTTLAHFLGHRLSKGLWTNPMLSVLAGAVLIRILYFVPVVKGLACLAVGVFGIGAALISRFGTRSVAAKPAAG